MKKPWEYGRLSTKADCPYLFNGEKLFFWMGDTAWLMFHNLKWEDICVYLRNRAERGFNVIQAAAVHHLPAESQDGQSAFCGGDVTRPDLEHHYWELVDRSIREAARLGMYVALLPHWGSFARELSLEQMESYVRFLAARYGKEPNIIWMTGGDTKGNEAAAYWRTMGAILKKECPDQLVTFHPFGRTSSIDYFAGESWVDFHCFQSGHRRYDQKTLGAWDDSHKQLENGKPYYGEDNWRYVKEAVLPGGRLPILDAEPSYEHIPQGLHLENEPFWNAQQVRRYAWWSVLAGACGFTYGHNSIMQFYSGTGGGAFFVKLPWKDALHAPACDSMTHFARVMNRVLETGWQDAGSAEQLLGGDCVWREEQREDRILALHAGPWLLCYTYSGRTVELNGRRLAEAFGWKSCTADCWWMNPVSGVESYFGNVTAQEGLLSFPAPQGDDSHDDWLLLLKCKEKDAAVI